MWKRLEGDQGIPGEAGGMLQINCPLCSAEDATELFELESPYIAGLHYLVHHCIQCQHRYATGPLSEEILDGVYGAAFHSTSQQQADSPSSAIMVNASHRAKWLSEYGVQGKLLDVGAGRGYFVKAAQDYFEARGIDYSPNAREYGEALGVELDSGDFLRSLYKTESFDVLTFWDVLASMVNLHEVVNRAAQLLRPGGYAVFTVPMGDSLACRLSGKRWPLWIPPVNLHYFSKQSLQYLFRDNGFEIAYVANHAKRVSLNFLMLKLARSMGLRSIEHTLAGMPLRWAIPINLGDIQTVLVRKA